MRGGATLAPAPCAEAAGADAAGGIPAPSEEIGPSSSDPLPF